MAKAKKNTKRVATKRTAKKATKKNGNGKKAAVKRDYAIQTEERGAPPILDKPTITGETLRSVVLRVDADFAMAVRKEAKSTGLNITAITRQLYRGMYGKK